jgi:fatty-acyl-CoA synthase
VGREVRGGALLRWRPAGALQLARAVRRWGATAAAACEAAALAFPERTAILDDHAAFTFAQLNERSAALSGALQQRGVGPGSTIAVRAGNHHWLVETLIAAARVQANVALLDPRSDAHHLSRIASREHLRALILDPEPSGARRGPVMFAAGAGPACPPARLDELIDGAAAQPAGVKGEIAAHVILSEPSPQGGWLYHRRPATLTAPSAHRAIPLRPRQRTMICAPLCSRWGHFHLMLGLRFGSTLVLSEQFDPLHALAALAEHRVSVLALRAEMLAAIVGLPAATLSWYPTPELRVIALGGPSLPGEVAIPAMRHFGPVLYTRRGPAMITLQSLSLARHLEGSVAAA